jgi:hypothetical protein
MAAIKRMSIEEVDPLLRLLEPWEHEELALPMQERQEWPGRQLLCPRPKSVRRFGAEWIKQIIHAHFQA